MLSRYRSLYHRSHNWNKLSICVSEEMPGLWGALRSLNINKLSLSGCLRVNNVELLSNSLSSLTQLKTLSIIVEKDSPGLWKPSGV
ncbi:hypothetical protein DPMN_164641 [Dreissena polymorpha]|uniref:Uncharacterized protein n=1 Tax=Dreissena polymorpha TaxID=45954 RepID=A0A9D4ETB5_DREPO|nr:hypothetical protein DPMN_164641 [Dreissena polymorpha]